MNFRTKNACNARYLFLWGKVGFKIRLFSFLDKVFRAIVKLDYMSNKEQTENDGMLIN